MAGNWEPIRPLASTNRLWTRRLAFVMRYLRGTQRMSVIHHDRQWEHTTGQFIRQCILNDSNSNFTHYQSLVSGLQSIRMTVNVQSLLFADYPPLPNMSDWEVIEPHLRDTNEFPPQCGSHLYHDIWGNLRTVWMYYIPDNQLIGFNQPNELTAIYPSVRFNVEQQPQTLHSILLGLVFLSTRFHPNPYQFGERYYTRYNRPPAIERRFGAFEMTEQYLQNYHNLRNTMPNNSIAFAIYVCSGAKLVVLDSYDDNNRNHNRSFIQPGGVILVDGLLQFCGPISIPDAWTWSLDQAVETGLFIGSAAQGIRNIQTPVLFLAPNDSKFESIAWTLEARESTDPNVPKPWRLYAPEGGRIAAIDTWSRGLDEIMARQLHEQLHMATADCLDPQFVQFHYQFPGHPDMQNRILGIGPYGERELDFNIRVAYPYFFPQVDPLVQYPKYSCDPLVIGQPFRPPLWPPVLFDVNNIDDHLLIPFFEKGTDCERKGDYLRVGDYRCKWKNDVRYEFPRYEIAEYDMSSHLHNEDLNYMGTDGWMYWYAFNPNQQKIPIGTYTTGAYIAVTKNDPNTGQPIDLHNWV